MAVLIEALSVIVKVSVLEARYPGGLDGFIDDCPNATFCSDDRLARVGFLDPRDVAAFLAYLGNVGLVLFDREGWRDVAVVDQLAAEQAIPCAWLAIGPCDDGLLGARALDPDEGPGDIWVPGGWRLDGSISRCAGPADATDTELHSYTHLETGLETYAPRLVGDVDEAGEPPRPDGGRLQPVVAAIAWARAVNRLDPSEVERFLAADLRVSFQGSIETIRGRAPYLEYWKRRFAQAAAEGRFTRAELAVTYDLADAPGWKRPCLVLHEGDGLVACVLLTVERDLIVGIDYCLLPDPATCNRSGHFPGLEPDEEEVLQ
jgi:hypothetical protein